MGLFIGLNGNTYVDNKSAELKYGTKIYGVIFNGSDSNGMRLYDAARLNFSPSSCEYKGIDDFYDAGGGISIPYS